MMIPWHQESKNLKEIADLTGKARSTVQSIIKKWKDTGCVENQWHNGPQSTFTMRDSNKLKRVIITNIGASTSHIFKTFLAETPKKFGRSALYKHLKNMSYVTRAIRKSMVVKMRNKKSRVKWAKARKNRALSAWKDFCFSDECSVVIGKDSRVYC